MRDQVEGRATKDGAMAREDGDNLRQCHSLRSYHSHDMGVLLIIAVVCVPFLIIAGVVVIFA